VKAIELANITKSYDGRTDVLSNISFVINEGEVFGFLGPNGAGKTTAVRILNGLLVPNSGDVKIYGKDISENIIETHRICGVMTETAQFYEKLTGFENLLFFGSLYGFSAGECTERIKHVMSLFDIYDAKDKIIGEYSTGMKKKIALCRAFLHNPKILFLDEPTSGLDPDAARNVSRLISTAAADEKVTVFLCTHQLKYAEEICTLYGFIDKGKMLGFGTFNELAANKNCSVTLEIRGTNIDAGLGFENKPQGIYNKVVASDNETAALIKQVINSGGEVYEARLNKWNLEDLYFAYQHG
jgi:ABC-2 type transport system ATP-binding protein